MEFILFVIAIWLIYKYFNGGKNSTNAMNPPGQNSWVEAHNKQWSQFIAGYLPFAKSKSEKQLLNKMLSDIVSQNMITQQYLDGLLDSTQLMPAEQTRQELSISRASLSVQPAKNAQDVRLDNISLLLYFGAFLFVASAGLFVSLAGASGVLRTLVVLLVTSVMYAAGIWIYENKSALKPAGLAFTGIGVAIAPLVGVAAYKYAFTGSASLVWLATSVLCLGMYGHAIVRLRRPLMNYLFMFTLLSLFESAVAVVGAPIYYFGWAMATLAIGLQALSAWKNIWPEFKETSTNGAQLFLPLAVFGSLVIIPQHGFGQFGVSLLLASLYYGFEATRTAAVQQENNAAASQISGVVAVGCLSYALTTNVLVAGLVLFVCAVLQVLSLTLVKQDSKLTYNAATIALASGVASTLFVYQTASIFTLVLALIIPLALVVWRKQHRADSYVLAGLSWVTLPFVFGQMALTPALSVYQQAWLCVAALAAHLGVFILAVLPTNQRAMIAPARSLLFVHIAIALVAALFVSSGLSILLISTIGLLILSLSFTDDSLVWGAFSGLVVSVSVMRCWTDPLLSIALFISLGYSILLALRFRDETNRWLSTVLWLLVPVGLGGATFQNVWTPAQYAWSYVLVMIGLLVSRLIARGVVFVSGKIPIGSYAKTASYSYVFGYILAAILAVGVSLGSSTSQLHTSAILGVISLLLFGVAWFVERKATLIALQPLIWQALLLSILRPKFELGSVELYLVLSTSLAVITYVLSRLTLRLASARDYLTEDVTHMVLFTMFITPASYLIGYNTAWPMPVGLLVAGLLLGHYNTRGQQDGKEASITIIVASVLWFMYYFGIRELQAYTHVIVLTLAGFAYWRYRKSERQRSDTYLYAMLSVATVPLVLQAINGVAGSLYGWWLLVEQIVFMIIGMTVKRHFVTMWGLYVAVAAVLYQLRDLGYAALAVLALFVIGIAVYQLQKYNKPDQ